MNAQIIINPGTGPVPEATEENAIINIKHWITDTGVDGIEYLRNPKGDFDGRYSFLVWKNTRCHIIDMPGIALEIVRSATPWVSPRLYVDGSSWLWNYSVLEESDFADPIES